MNWYYSDGKQQLGPVEEPRLDELVATGVVRDDTLVWREGMPSWQAHATVRGQRNVPIIESVPAQGSGMPGGFANEMRYCVQCGNSFPVRELVTLGSVSVCANCKPLYLQRMREGGQTLGTMGNTHYGGFWIRFLARIIDGVLLGIVSLLIRIPLGLAAVAVPGTGAGAGVGLGLIGIAGLLSVAVYVAYEAFFLTTRGATPGKMALGLRVVMTNGGPISVGTAIGRYFAGWVSGIIFAIGYIMAGFDEQKRSLHDRICNTLVIYTR